MKLYERVGKRLFDVAATAVLLVLLAPLIGAVTGMIRIIDGSPVLFRQVRIGRGGTAFTSLKFRTMPVGTVSAPSASVGEVHLTRTGGLLRRLSLDELPQLINVFRGDMSLVGPRPPIPEQVELCEMRRASGALQCRPGLTGLAQVNAYDGMPDVEKARWDAQYARCVTLRRDLAILARTVAYLTKPPPQY